VPASLGEALDVLEKDHAFLLKGDVFTTDFLETWVSHKRKEPTPCACAPIPTNSTCITMSNFAGTKSKVSLEKRDQTPKKRVPCSL